LASTCYGETAFTLCGRERQRVDPIGCPLAATSETLILTVRRYFARKKRIRLTLESSVGLVFRVAVAAVVFQAVDPTPNPARS